MVWWWFGANMAGQRNKNVFKFLLILLILSQKHIFGVTLIVSHHWLLNNKNCKKKKNHLHIYTQQKKLRKSQKTMQHKNTKANNY